jgi:hypothetical protein
MPLMRTADYIQTPLYFVRSEVLTAVAMKNAVFWDVAPCRPCVKMQLLAHTGSSFADASTQ